MNQHFIMAGLNVMANTWINSRASSSSLATSSLAPSSLAPSSLAPSTAAPVNNCSDLVGPPVCNITACNFGHGCIIDFSTMDTDPWRVMVPWRLALFGVGLAVTTVPGVIGNILVISIVLGNKIMQNDINMFILNMAVADLIASIVLPPTFLVSNVFQAYMLGAWWCKYGGTVRLTLLLTSVFSISVISVDRIWRLMRPFHRQIPPIAIRSIMLSTWVVAGAIAFYPSQFNKYSKRQYRDFLDIMCEQTDIARMRIFWWVMCVFLIWVPALILFTCFVIIFIKMRHINVSRKKSGHHRFISPATRARQRAVRLVFAMFVTFFVCWSPFLVYVLLYQLVTTTHDNGRAWDELYYASHFMMHLVPVINPILYALMHENFRRAATVTCPWLPSKVKYQAFQTGDGGRVRWSERGFSHASAPNLQSLANAAENQRRQSQIRRCQSLAEVSLDRHQSGATVASTSPPAKYRPAAKTGPASTVAVKVEAAVGAGMGAAAGAAAAPGGAGAGAAEGTPPPAMEGRRSSRVSGERLSQVALIWSALMEHQRQRLDPLSLSPLPGIAEENESRKSSIMSSIDLNEIICPGATPAATPAAGSIWMSRGSGHYNMAYAPD